MSVDFDRVRAMTFDCYGTLIDWESGLLRAVKPALAVHGVVADDESILEAFAELEAREETGTYKPYREVLRCVMIALGDRFGARMAERQLDGLAESIARWPAFSDTPAALRALAGRFSLNIISNIDDALFEGSRGKLGTAVDRVVTAEYCRSYKPSLRNFKVMLALLDASPGEVVHVAQSLYHDVGPAQSLGIQTVWVNRRAGRRGFGATPRNDVIPDLLVLDLAQLARLVGV